jgi:DNA primase
MFYPDEIIEEVRLHNDVVDVIGSYVHLQKKGSSHFGLCPFHNEKTPSFSVSKDKQMYYCFGCGAGGNVFSFIMAYENYSFVESVKYLAERAHIELPEPEVSEEVKKAINYKQRLYDANRLAARYYYSLLRKDVGKRALAYFQDRKLSADIMKQFGLGYATQFRDDLYKYLQKQGFLDQELLDCGLLLEDKKHKGEYYDRFFNRVMFPIFDVHGKVIAFGGRVLGEGQPKYLNSPETKLFDKSRNLYGLNIARKSRESFMIVVEGYMDVIALHQAGFDNAIASLGTAFTSGHGQLIKRYVDEVVIAFDGDGAGVNAALRSIPILKSAGLIVRVLNMETAKDPDEFIQNQGVEAFQTLLHNATASFMFEIKQLSKRFDLTDPEYRTRFSEEVAKKLLSIEGKIERDNYLEAIVSQYHMSKSGLYELLAKHGNNVGIAQRTPQTMSRDMGGNSHKKREEGTVLAQKQLLAILVSNYKIFNGVKDIIQPEYFTHDTLQKVAYIVFDIYKTKQEIEPADIMRRFTQIEDQKMIANIFSEELKVENQQQLEKLLNDTIRNIKGDYLEQKRMNVNDPSGLMTLIQEKKALLNFYLHLDEIDRRD